MTTATIELEHFVQVAFDGFEHRAECGCGWASDWYDDDTAATDAGIDHREVAVGPPDAFDGLMSGLLDLQEDIARVVMWLAENWRADLPVPGWHSDGGGDRADGGVRVLAFCRDGAVFRRAAELLEVEPFDATEPNPFNGNLYRRACRSFGRVTVEAFTTVGGEAS